MQSDPPPTPGRGPLAYATAPVRLVGDLGVALAYTAHELPHLVQDLRQLVNDLSRAARPDGELIRLLDDAAALARARAARERGEATERAKLGAVS